MIAGANPFADAGVMTAMDPDPDELAGVTDVFGALSRAEILQAFEDLAARSGADFDPDRLEEGIEAALSSYYLVAVERDGRELLAAGPAALPRLPEGGEALPDLLSVDPRPVEPAALGEAAVERLRGEAARAVNEADDDRIEALLDVCYDLEAWAPVETADLRDRLADAR